MNAKPGLAAELMSEFLGTFVLILFGTGVVAMVVLFPSGSGGGIVHGGYTNITLGWGLAVTMGIYIAGKISGAHLNPAFAGFSPGRSAAGKNRWSLYDLPCLSGIAAGWVPGSGDWYRFASPSYIGHHGRIQFPSGREPGALDDRTRGRSDRHELWGNARVPHQSSARSRAAPIHGGRGFSQQWHHRRKPGVVGAGGGASGGWAGGRSCL